MRQTAKLLAARKAAKKALAFPLTFTDETLYDALASRGYWWDSSEGEWKNTPQPSTSMFKDDEGNPSGLLRVRLMGMTEDAQAFLQSVKVEGWTLAEKSAPYPNRKGPGYRWYLTYKRNS